MDETADESRENHEAFSRCWKTARRNFGDSVFFFAPALKHYDTQEFSQQGTCRVRAVSITGTACQLMCEHCNARVLAGMTPAPTAEELFDQAAIAKSDGITTLLISGGSDSNGVVPLAPYTGVFARVRDELSLRIIVHTGITDTALARQLAAAGVDAALIDIPGADATIHEICHLEGATTADFDRSLANLCGAGLKVIPHIVIGLHRGEIVGEPEALRIVSGHEIESLVLVGLRPLAGTPLAGAAPPPPTAMAAVFLEARLLLPRTGIMLGCERPGGRHKERTDILALEAGLNGIAFPADGVVTRARELGLEPRFSTTCCAVPFADPGLMGHLPLSAAEMGRAGVQHAGAGD